MTAEDKLWIGSGIALALTGGIYYFVAKSKNDKALALEMETEMAEEPVVTTPVIPIKTPTLSTPPIQSTTTSLPSTPREAESFRYSVGQEVMATGFNGTKTYDARRMADGNYTSEGIRKATFKKGDKIGTIIWVGRRPDGTYRYVAQRSGAFLNDIYWIADHSVIKPVGKILPVISSSPTIPNSIDKNKLLQKGSKGMEVRTLQVLLKVKVDGDFGSNTQKALFNQKGVKQIRLKDWR
jgi:hypothetical protein